MFVNNKFVFNTVNVFIRSFHCTSSQLVRHRKHVSNPGINYQVGGFKEEAELFKNDPEGFGDLESDFMEVHRSHKEHQEELSKRREHVRHLIVKHKYFREQRLPNLLFYSEKEQIRLLHARDPEEWSPEKLAESFPATPEIIRNILEANWKPRSLKRLKKHDEAVIRNWEALKANESQENALKVPKELREHLLKFYDRKGANLVPPELAKQLLRPELPKPKSQEFLSIITSCPGYRNDEEQSRGEISGNVEQQLIEDPEHQLNGLSKKHAKSHIDGRDLEKETYLLGEIENTQRMRFEDLKKTKAWSDFSSLNDQSANTIPNASDLVCDNPSGTGVLKSGSTSEGSSLNFVEKYQSNEILISNEDQKRFEITKVKDHIHIPRKLFKRGATYRVDDSYYDDDGEFLYRVPGMVGFKDKN